MRLIAMMPWMTVEQVLSKMEFEPLIADKLERMEPPTDEELTIIRAQIDPGGLTVSRGEWIAIDRETGQRAQ
jgi:glutaconate CoA-transferase subunit B